MSEARIKRAGIFLFFNPDGIVYDYVTYLLSDICKVLDDLVIMCNGNLLSDGKEKLERYTHKVYIRPNIGFDAGAWKEALVQKCGREYFDSFDELVLFNDSFFGPFRPFSCIFDEMENKNVDFWGLSSHGAAPSSNRKCPYGNRPRYIQTYFLTIQSRLLHSDDFWEYWEEMPLYKTFDDLVEKNQCVFTKHFEDKGYSWAVFSDTSDLESDDITKNMSHHMFNTYDMVVRRKFPIIKRKCFVIPKSTYLYYGLGANLQRTMKYLDTETGYDTSLIWDYLLRNYNLRDLYESVNLVEVLPEHIAFDNSPIRDTAVIGYLFYADQFNYYLEKLNNLPKEIDVFLATDTAEKGDVLNKHINDHRKNNWHVVVGEPRGRDLASLLVACKGIPQKYKYLCYFHDKKSSLKEFSSVGSDFRDLLIQNTIGSEQFVRNVIKTFNDNPRLGMLVPPCVYHGSYFSSQINYWTLCFEGTKDILGMLGIDVPLDKEKPPFGLGTCFWCRTDALKSLFDYEWHYEDFPEEPFPRDGSISHCLERSFPYIAQGNGYYTKTVMTDFFADIEIANFRYMMENTARTLVNDGGADRSSYRAFSQSIALSSSEGGHLKMRLKKAVKRYKRFVPDSLWAMMKDIGNKL